jgi:hypothetical protein
MPLKYFPNLRCVLTENFEAALFKSGDRGAFQARQFVLLFSP